MTDIHTVFAIVSVVMVRLIWDRLPVIAVCVASALSLWGTDVLTLGQSLAVIGDPAQDLHCISLDGSDHLAVLIPAQRATLPFWRN